MQRIDWSAPWFAPVAGAGRAVQGAQAAVMTNEQRIRGADRGVDMALILTGYDADAVATEAYEVILQERAGAVPDIDAIAPLIHARTVGADDLIVGHYRIATTMHVDAMHVPGDKQFFDTGAVRPFFDLHTGV